MKEEELLLPKEEVDKIKESRDALLSLGVGIFLLGVVVSQFQSVVLVVSGTIGIICCIVAGLKYERDYENKLKELKKVIGVNVKTVLNQYFSLDHNILN